MHHLGAEVLGDDLVLAGLVAEFVQEVLVRLGVRESGKRMEGGNRMKTMHLITVCGRRRPRIPLNLYSAVSEAMDLFGGCETSSLEKLFDVEMGVGLQLTGLKI